MNEYIESSNLIGPVRSLDSIQSVVSRILEFARFVCVFVGSTLDLLIATQAARDSSSSAITSVGGLSCVC